VKNAVNLLKIGNQKDGECDLKELNYWEVDNFYTNNLTNGNLKNSPS